MLNKKYLKSKPICKVTFHLPKKLAKNAGKIHVVGDFNNWNKSKTPLIGLKNGSFKATLDLETGKEYQFRYFVDGKHWENDSQADKYVPNGYGEDNSVVIL